MTALVQSIGNGGKYINDTAFVLGLASRYVWREMGLIKKKYYFGAGPAGLGCADILAVAV